MKTKQFFITLIFSVLLTACTTDDIIEQEAVNLKSIEQQSRISEDFEYYNQDDGEKGANMVKTLVCTYNDYFYVYYSYSSIHHNNKSGIYTSANLRRMSFLRDNFISNEIYNLTINGCPKYKIPENPDYNYSINRDQYYEIWEAIDTEDTVCKICPGGDKDDVEL